jgi:hypothetical protein
LSTKSTDAGRVNLRCALSQTSTFGGQNAMEIVEKPGKSTFSSTNQAVKDMKKN